MTPLVVHDDVILTGGVTLERSLRSIDGSRQSPDRHRPFDGPAVSKENNPTADLNDRRVLNECGKIIPRKTSHAQLLLSGPSRPGSEALAAVKFKPLICKVNFPSDPEAVAA